MLFVKSECENKIIKEFLVLTYFFFAKCFIFLFWTIWKKLFMTRLLLFTSDADPWHFGVDPDPDLDARIHARDYWIRILLFSSLTFKMPTKNKKQKTKTKKKFFCLLLIEDTSTSFFKDKKSKRNHFKAEGIKVF